MHLGLLRIPIYNLSVQLLCPLTHAANEILVHRNGQTRWLSPCLLSPQAWRASTKKCLTLKNNSCIISACKRVASLDTSRCSSAAEQRFCKPPVVSSILTIGSSSYLLEVHKT